MKEIVTRTERIRVDDSGIVVCEIIPGVIFDVSDARENIAAIAQLANGKPVPVFVDITKAKGITREARAYFADDTIANTQRACALLVDSPLSRLMGNFFLGLNRTKFPIQLFSDESAAKDWLKQFLQ